jgi:hypothetical protein
MRTLNVIRPPPSNTVSLLTTSVASNVSVIGSAPQSKVT